MDDDGYEVYKAYEEPEIIPDLQFLQPLNYSQAPEPEFILPLPEPQPQVQPEMMVHVADFNPVFELYDVLPMVGFPYPPIPYEPQSRGYNSIFPNLL